MIPRARIYRILMMVAGLGCLGCGAGTSTPTTEPPPEYPAWFEEVTDQIRANFTHDPGPTDRYLMYQTVGSGCAIHDLDGDGRPDLLFLTNAGPTSASRNRLFRQAADHTFEDVSAGSGLDFPGLNMGVAIGDFDNDGRPDVLITQVRSVRLFRNLGQMKFEDVTAKMGVANPLWGTSAAFFDYDRDGWLDLFIVNYVDYDTSWPCRSPTGELDYCAPKVFHGTSSKLFRNVGGTRYEDVSVRSHIGDLPGPGLGLVVADFTGDGWPDVFVANDGQPNRLWINRTDGTFADEATSRGVAYTQSGMAFAGMGVAVGDIDNDGLLDLYVTHLTSETNTLWMQGPRGLFRDRTLAQGLTTTRWRATGFGTAMADYDQDGWIDLVIANGRVSRESPTKAKPSISDHWAPYAERNQVLANLGNGKFTDRSPGNPAWSGYFTVARGLASGDIDGDGAPDLIVNAVGEKARVFRNVAPTRGHWLAIRARDLRSGRDLLGTEVTVSAGGIDRVRVISSADSFLSASPAIAHFGLGSAATYDRVTVRWPDGTKQDFPGGKADCLLDVTPTRPKP